jgi:hypothetical protein
MRGRRAEQELALSKGGVAPSPGEPNAGKEGLPKVALGFENSPAPGVEAGAGVDGNPKGVAGCVGAGMVFAGCGVEVDCSVPAIIPG